MARAMEPGLGIATALRTEELERCIAKHGINLIANNKGRRIFLAHLDTEPLVIRQPRHIGQLTGAYKLSRIAYIYRIAIYYCI